MLAVSSDRGCTQLWDVAARRRTGPRLTGHEGGVLNAEDTGLDGALKPP